MTNSDLEMSDLEITRLCAEAMGYTIVSNDPNWTDGPVRTEVAHHPGTIMIRSSRVYPHTYLPLHDDAQMAALIKKFPVTCIDALDYLIPHGPERDEDYQHLDLNRAVAKGVARKEKGK